MRGRGSRIGTGSGLGCRVGQRRASRGAWRQRGRQGVARGCGLASAPRRRTSAARGEGAAGQRAPPAPRGGALGAHWQPSRTRTRYTRARGGRGREPSFGSLRSKRHLIIAIIIAIAIINNSYLPPTNFKARWSRPLVSGENKSSGEDGEWEDKSPGYQIYIYIYICIHIYISLSLYIYIYIYIHVSPAPVHPLEEHAVDGRADVALRGL